MRRRSDSIAPKAPGAATDAARWRAVEARDERFDGVFFYAVRTTGIYCRPSCPARRPKRENVIFHPTSAAAAGAGFRPCRRCRPDALSIRQNHVAIVTEACRMIERAEQPPRLDTLAQGVGVSPHHLHRIFKAMLGVTPKAFATAHRNQRLRDGLAGGATVTDAIYAAGFQSSGRFYETANEVLGMTAKDYRGGGDGEMRFAIGACSLGSVLVAASAKGVTAIFIGDDPAALIGDLEKRFPKATLISGDRGFEKTVAQVVGLIEAPGADVDLPLDMRGTAFQHRVWEALCKIPSGTTVTYAEIAERLGMPKAVRAVASACAANKIAIAIPCHRVVRNGGALAGYRWGVEIKRELLRREWKK